MKQILLILVIAVLLLSACSQPKNLVYQDVQHVSMKHAGLNKTTLSMDVRLYNPNAYRIQLKRADLDIYINNNLLGKINIDQKITVPGADTFLLPAVLDLSLSSALPSLLQLAFSSDISLKLAGSVKAGRHGIFITIPVNYEGKQDLGPGFKW